MIYEAQKLIHHEQAARNAKKKSNDPKKVEVDAIPTLDISKLKMKDFDRFKKTEVAQNNYGWE